MTLRELLDPLPPDAMLPVAWVRKHLGNPQEAEPRAPQILSTRQAARWFGLNPKRWRVWAEEGLIEGAFQEAEGGPWRLPVEGCQRRIIAFKNAPRVKSKARGPYRKAPPTHAGSPRPQIVSEG